MADLFFRGRHENAEIITTIRKGDIFIKGSSHDQVVPVNAVETAQSFSQPGVLYLDSNSNSWGISMQANMQWKRSRFLPSGLVVKGMDTLRIVSFILLENACF